MITRIEAHNYRCFPKLSVGLSRYHVLAGANGAGKTTFLDIPVLVGDMIRERRVVAAFLEQGEARQVPRATTLTDLPHKGTGETIGFAFEAKLPEDVREVLVSLGTAVPSRLIPTHLRYELRLEVTTRSLSVSDEYLFLFSEDGSRPKSDVDSEKYKFPQGNPRGDKRLEHADWQPVILRQGNSLTRYLPEIETRPASATPAKPSRQTRRAQPEVRLDIRPIQILPEQLALGAVPPDRALFPAAVWFMELLRDDVVFFNPDWDALRSPAPPGYPRRLIASGQNLPWLALDLQNSDPEDFTAWIDHVRTALPQICDIRAVEREEDHYAYFSVEYEGGYRVTSSGLSDGTLRILAITIIPFLPEDAMPGLLVTEEPENGIHPRAIETGVESLSSLFGTQVWVSTHSPIVLAHTQLHDILATRIEEDGRVTVVPGDQHPRLREWQGEADLGTLFAAGVLS
ncbi:MAG TPA: AAA family ATPase [Streptosporangiaceae bacterium]|nr:AAA family ATPase [Streptosporangiaceae bacterium]